MFRKFLNSLILFPRRGRLPLLLLLLAQILIAIIGLILFGIGIFVAIPLIIMMQSYTYRLLGNPKLYEEVQI